MRPVVLVVAAVAALLANGCTPSPDALCEHTTTVVERQFGPDDPSNPEASHVAGVKRCLEQWDAKKKQDPKAYECYARCATDTKALVDLAACRPKCYPGEAKPADEPEKAESLFWSPDASTSASAPPSPAPAPEASTHP